MWLHNFLLDTNHNKEHQENEHSSSFTDDEDGICKVVDTFRYFHPGEEKVYSCWNTRVNARELNYGSRIDYIFTDLQLLKSIVKDSSVRTDVHGSDYCPVEISCNFEPIKCKKLPRSCTKYYPELAGTQQKLSQFLLKPNEGRANQNDENFKRKNDENDFPQKKKQMNLKSFFTNQKENSVTNTKENNDAETNGKAQSLTDELKFLKSTNISTNNNSKEWNFLMKKPKPPPTCRGHKEPCVLRTVKKKGPNLGRQFYSCPRGSGQKGDPEATCETFIWARDHINKS